MTRFSAADRPDPGRTLFKDKPKKANEAPARDSAGAIQVGEHGRYQVKSGRIAGEYIARAFPKPPTIARGVIAEAKGATEEAAIAALHAMIDARETQRTEGRRTDPQSGAVVPSAEEYVEAIAQITLSRPQHAMLLELSLAGDAGLTERRMASAAGYKSIASANRAFAGAGLLIATYLSADTAGNGSSSDLEGASFLGFRGTSRNDTDPGNWILHPEVRDAIRPAK